MRANPRVDYASLNYIARAAQGSDCTPGVPNDPGEAGVPCGWRQTQWNFLPCASLCSPGQPAPFESRGGINAIDAWATLAARGRPGARGVRVAVLDTGVAFRGKRPRFRKSPDFRRRQFLPGFDFVSGDPLPLDQTGHGTHVAGTIAEVNGNGIALTGLAPSARVIPVRVLDQSGSGTAHDIARGVRFAAAHGAKVINMSFEFGGGVTRCRQLRGLCRAIRFATLRKGALVVAAAGNSSKSAASFPARAPRVLGIAAGTEGACLATYSNRGAGVDLTAPGGSGESSPPCLVTTPDRPIVQLTFRGRGFRQFGFPRIYHGTSMASAHASGVAAMVIASGVLGARPRPGRIACQLGATARRTSLGQPYSPTLFGAGLLDAAAAVRAAAC